MIDHTNGRKLVPYSGQCVLDYIWDQVRGQHRRYDIKSLEQELLEYVCGGPQVSTRELLDWVNDRHNNVSIYAYDASYRRFTHRSNNCSNVVLVLW